VLVEVLAVVLLTVLDEAVEVVEVTVWATVKVVVPDEAALSVSPT
jgi:hypothetical protein